MDKCLIKDLGLIDYQKAYHFQNECVTSVIQGESQQLLVCEHPVVLTLGRRSKKEYILLSDDELKEKHIEIFRIDRGGEVTLHCPGQLVVYPILRLNNYKKDLKYYLNLLEQVGINFCKEYDIFASRFPGRTGVWVQERKIASIGLGVRNWVSYHGMAMNITADLKLFSMIKPCGLDVDMTSIQEIKDCRVDFNKAKQIFIENFCKKFSLKPE